MMLTTQTAEKEVLKSTDEEFRLASRRNVLVSQNVLDCIDAGEAQSGTRVARLTAGKRTFSSVHRKASKSMSSQKSRSDTSSLISGLKGAGVLCMPRPKSLLLLQIRPIRILALRRAKML